MTGGEGGVGLDPLGDGYQGTDLPVLVGVSMPGYRREVERSRPGKVPTRVVPRKESRGRGLS